MQKIGKKIYYDKNTGEVILDTGERQGLVVVTTINQDVENYTTLSERNRNTFDVLELPYGAHAQDFAECNGYRVNPETKKLEFSHPIPGEPDAPQVFGPPLTDQIEGLKQENNDLMMAIVELADSNEADKMETQLAMVELAELIMMGVGE